MYSLSLLDHIPLRFQDTENIEAYLLRAFDFRWYLATLGAVVWAFSSYFFIIIAAGHIWKVIALAYHKGTEVFNLGTGSGYSVLDIVKAFIKVNKIDIPYVIKPAISFKYLFFISTF